MNSLAKTLIFFGILLITAGVLLLLAGKLNIPFGKLPGDITVHKKNLTVFAPFGTMLIVSVVISLLLNIFSRFK